MSVIDEYGKSYIAPATCAWEFTFGRYMTHNDRKSTCIRIGSALLISLFLNDQSVVTMACDSR